MTGNNTPNDNALMMDGLSDIGIMGAYSLRRIFILLTRLHYSDPSHYGEEMGEKLSKFIWSKEDTKCTLPITYDYNYNAPTYLDRSPAIYVGCSDTFYARKVSDDFVRTVEDRSATQRGKTGGIEVIIRHKAKEPDDALLLGECTTQYYFGLKTLLQERLHLTQFDVSKAMSSRPFLRTPQEADKQFVVDLVLQIQFNAAWLTLRESHRIKTITVGQFMKELT